MKKIFSLVVIFFFGLNLFNTAKAQSYNDCNQSCANYAQLIAHVNEQDLEMEYAYYLFCIAEVCGEEL